MFQILGFKTNKNSAKTVKDKIILINSSLLFILYMTPMFTFPWDLVYNLQTYGLTAPLKKICPK